MKNLLSSLLLLFISFSAFACECEVTVANVFFGSFTGVLDINSQVVTSSETINLPAGPVTVSYTEGVVGNTIRINCEGITVYNSGVLFTTEETPLVVFNLAENCSNCPEFGMQCDDMNSCTVDDLYNISCECVGTFQDSDEDGVCDTDDQCPGMDDLADENENGEQDCLEGVLPAIFLGENAVEQNGKIKISWRVSQDNVSHYHVQRRFNQTWENNAYVEATDQSEELYSVIVDAPAGENIYRIESVDKDNSKGYSEVFSFQLQRVYKDFIEIKLHNGVQGLKRI